MSRATLAAAVVVAMVAVGGAFFLLERGQPSVVGPIPTPEASASPSQPAVAVPSTTPAPTPTSTAEASPPPVGDSLDLTWSKVTLDQRSPQVAWLDDRFVMVDDDSGVVQTSIDGFSWHVLQPGDPDPGYLELIRDVRGGGVVSWGDDIVRWWNPEEGAEIAGKPPITARDIVRIVRAGAATDTTPFKGRIASLGVGPAGIVAFVHSHLDWDEWVASKLGRNWVSHYTGVDFKNGILKIGMDNGPGLKVNWAEEGFEPGDYQDAGFGWYSPEGEQWTQIPDYLSLGIGGDVIGVSDGFVARGESMWHSSDGLTWRNMGEAASSMNTSMLPWHGGALISDGFGSFDLWTSQGSSELPMAAEIRAAKKHKDPDLNSAFDVGPLGLVRVTLCRDGGGDPCPPDGSANEVLVTRDGTDWSIQPIPAELAADNTGFNATPRVVVGERSVLVTVLSGPYEARIASLWLGTLEP